MIETQRLEELNALRKLKGEQPIEKWTGSKKLFNATLDKLRNEKPAEARGVAKRKASKKRKTSPPKKQTGDGIRLTSICVSMKKDPKVARARLRKLYQGGGRNLPKKLGGSWVFSAKDEKRLRELVAGK